MEVLLSKIEDVFDISGRGVVVVPGIPLDGRWKIKTGDRVCVKRPDGSVIQTTVRGIERGGRGLKSTPILLGLEIAKSDAPIGSELWADDALKMDTD